ncbi:MAG: dTDP-4-dehydrorhamnose 3,5-epimerase [Xanthobacteraceae bacterium]
MSSVQLSVVSDSASFIKKTAKEARILRPKVPWTNVISLAIPEVLVIEPKILGDQRGFFFEAFQAERYASYGITRPFVQDNISRSANGVLRGLHLQNPKCQGKLLNVLRGSVLDVAVDVRLGSPTFGRHVSAELSEENRRQIWIPGGFAHGFLVLSESADIFYKCDDLYSPTDEITLRWNDPVFHIKWGIESPSLSARDAAAPFLAEVKGLPIYGKC